jgi:hypothetical protein
MNEHKKDYTIAKDTKRRQLKKKGYPAQEYMKSDHQ